MYIVRPCLVEIWHPYNYTKPLANFSNNAYKFVLIVTATYLPMYSYGISSPVSDLCMYLYS